MKATTAAIPAIMPIFPKAYALSVFKGETLRGLFSAWMELSYESRASARMHRPRFGSAAHRYCVDVGYHGAQCIQHRHRSDQ
jgi:hypothetical protein